MRRARQPSEPDAPGHLGRLLVDGAVAWGILLAVVGVAGRHLDAGGLSQVAGLQGTWWARRLGWGERWWAYAVWLWPLVTALWARLAVARSLRTGDRETAWATALGAAMSLFALGFIVMAGTPGLLSATMGEERSRLLFVGTLLVPIPVLLVVAAATMHPGQRAGVERHAAADGGPEAPVP